MSARSASAGSPPSASRGWSASSSFRSAGDEAEILSIAVRRSHRGRGHGRLLMDEALRRLYRERIGTCFLEVDPDNAAAVTLYRSLGFAQVGDAKGLL